MSFLCSSLPRLNSKGYIASCEISRDTNTNFWKGHHCVGDLWGVDLLLSKEVDSPLPGSIRSALYFIFKQTKNNQEDRPVLNEQKETCGECKGDYVHGGWIGRPSQCLRMVNDGVGWHD